WKGVKTSIQIKAVAKLGDIYEFDNLNSLCLKSEIKVGGNWQIFNRGKICSLNITAWKLYYILDILEDDCHLNLKKGFQYYIRYC
ncbi:hypothetical protein C2G38_2252212, partial [Gigaspora rosea]